MCRRTARRHDHSDLGNGSNGLDVIGDYTDIPHIAGPVEHTMKEFERGEALLGGSHYASQFSVSPEFNDHGRN
jgi:hypothetical protein